MRKLLLILLWIACPVLMLSAQNVDYNKIILPDEAANVSFEERLVQLAWRNNPASKIAAEEVVLNHEELRIKRAEWSSMLGVTGNLNEFNVRDITETNSDNGNLFFPRYNFFIQLPLSLLVENPHEKRAAISRVRVSEQKVNLLKLELRTRVLKLYSEYKKMELIWIIKKQSMADEESNYLLIEQKFKNGDTSVEEYMRAQRGRNDIKIQLAIAENDFQKARLDLEEVIGIPIQDAK